MHGDGVRVKGTGAERDNDARGRCTGAREGAGRGSGQSAITVHGDGARVHGKRCRGTGQRAMTVHGDGAGLYAEGQGGDRGRAR